MVRLHIPSKNCWYYTVTGYPKSKCRRKIGCSRYRIWRPNQLICCSWDTAAQSNLSADWRKLWRAKIHEMLLLWKLARTIIPARINWNGMEAPYKQFHLLDVLHWRCNGRSLILELSSCSDCVVEPEISPSTLHAAQPKTPGNIPSAGGHKLSTTSGSRETTTDFSKMLRDPIKTKLQKSTEAHGFTKRHGKWRVLHSVQTLLIQQKL